MSVNQQLQAESPKKPLVVLNFSKYQYLVNLEHKFYCLKQEALNTKRKEPSRAYLSSELQESYLEDSKSVKAKNHLFNDYRDNFANNKINLSSKMQINRKSQTLVDKYKDQLFNLTNNQSLLKAKQVGTNKRVSPRKDKPTEEVLLRQKFLKYQQNMLNKEVNHEEIADKQDAFNPKFCLLIHCDRNQQEQQDIINYSHVSQLLDNSEDSNNLINESVLEVLGFSRSSKVKKCSKSLPKFPPKKGYGYFSRDLV